MLELAGPSASETGTPVLLGQNPELRWPPGGPTVLFYGALGFLCFVFGVCGHISFLQGSIPEALAPPPGHPPRGHLSPAPRLARTTGRWGENGQVTGLLCLSLNARRSSPESTAWRTTPHEELGPWFTPTPASEWLVHWARSGQPSQCDGCIRVLNSEPSSGLCFLALGALFSPAAQFYVTPRLACAHCDQTGHHDPPVSHLSPGCRQLPT